MPGWAAPGYRGRRGHGVKVDLRARHRVSAATTRASARTRRFGEAALAEGKDSHWADHLHGHPPFSPAHVVPRGVVDTERAGCSWRALCERMTGRRWPIRWCGSLRAGSRSSPAPVTSRPTAAYHRSGAPRCYPRYAALAEPLRWSARRQERQGSARSSWASMTPLLAATCAAALPVLVQRAPGSPDVSRGCHRLPGALGLAGAHSTQCHRGVCAVATLAMRKRFPECDRAHPLPKGGRLWSAKRRKLYESPPSVLTTLRDAAKRWPRATRPRPAPEPAARPAQGSAGQAWIQPEPSSVDGRYGADWLGGSNCPLDDWLYRPCGPDPPPPNRVGRPPAPGLMAAQVQRGAVPVCIQPAPVLVKPVGRRASRAAARVGAAPRGAGRRSTKAQHAQSARRWHPRAGA